MVNLPVDRKCDCHTLEQYGIKIVSAGSGLFSGKLGKFKLTWCAPGYWRAEGPVPLDIAEELYRSKVGRRDVRVAGKDECPPPKHYLTFFDEEGRRLIEETGKLTYSDDPIVPKILEREGGVRYVADPAREGRAFVTLYYIVSQVGLQLFIDSIKHLA